MTSPCTVLVDTDNLNVGTQAGDVVQRETLRIEAKYSRYGPSVVTTINQNGGFAIVLDTETADLIDYAVTCHELSDGHFDITSGALRKLWRPYAGSSAPDPLAVREALESVGWRRVVWERPVLQLPAGMEIDLEAIGRRYAIDRALKLAQAETDAPILVNLGGDLAVSGPRRDGSGWRVAIADVDLDGTSSAYFELDHGALATRGRTFRHVKHAGRRHERVFDPMSGWPIPDAPSSVTVHAPTCAKAGLLAELALLRGKDAEIFLREEQARGWCIR